MRLYLMRHGDASAGHPDRDRPLSELGRQELETAGQILARVSPKPKILEHSLLRRARESAEILGRHLQIPSRERQGLLPDDRPAALADELRVRSQDSIVVGHLPFLEILVSELIYGEGNRSAVSLSTGTVAVLEGGIAGFVLIALLPPEFRR